MVIPRAAARARSNEAFQRMRRKRRTAELIRWADLMPREKHDQLGTGKALCKCFSPHTK